MFNQQEARPRQWLSVKEEDYVLHEGESVTCIETNEPMSERHQHMYNQLYQYIQNLIERKETWTYIPEEEKNLESKQEEEEPQPPKKKSWRRQKIKTRPVPDEYLNYLREYAHKSCIARHLKGSDYHLERAKKSFKTVVEWRIRERIDSKTYLDFRDVLDNSLVCCTFERDKLGHPIAYFKFPSCVLNSEQWDRVHRCAVFAAEKGAQLSGERGLFQTTWILDFANLNRQTRPPMAHIKQMVHLWTAYYPERLYRAYIVNASKAFEVVWAIAKNFLSQNTRNKVIPLKGPLGRQAESFNELIEATSLHVDYGGEWNETYSFEYEEEGRRARGEVVGDDDG